MTLPNEQYHAIVNTRNFLLSLMDTKKTKVPLAVRTEARRLLKHYPLESEVNDIIRVHTEHLFEASLRSEYKMLDSAKVEYSPRHGGWIFWDSSLSEPSKPYLSWSDAVEGLNSYLKEIENG